MAQPQRPSVRRTPRGEFDRVDAQREQDRRDRYQPAPPVPLVKLEPEPAESWPPGTAWLDTSV